MITKIIFIYLRHTLPFIWVYHSTLICYASPSHVYVPTWLHISHHSLRQAPVTSQQHRQKCLHIYVFSQVHYSSIKVTTLVACRRCICTITHGPRCKILNYLCHESDQKTSYFKIASWWYFIIIHRLPV